MRKPRLKIGSPGSPMNQSGQGLTEYLILLVLIAIASIAVTQTLGKHIKTKIKEARIKINEGIRFE